MSILVVYGMKGKMNKLRFLSGGGHRKKVHIGPCLAKAGYSTVANGHASDIAPRTGEVAVLLTSGDGYTFARWILGPPEEVVEWLENKGRHALAAEVSETALPDPTPFAEFANALMSTGASLQDVQAAANIANVSIVRRK